MVRSRRHDQLQRLPRFTQRDILARFGDEVNHFRVRRSGNVRTQSIAEPLEFGGGQASLARVEEENRIDGTIRITLKLALVLGSTKFEIKRTGEFLRLKRGRCVNLVMVLSNVRFIKKEISFSGLRLVFLLHP